MSEITFLDNYVKKMGVPLIVDQERYGGSYTAIVMHMDWATWIFYKLGGDDFDGTQAQYLLSNQLLPAASGNSLSQALRRLNAKLEALYSITDEDGRNGVKRKFSLVAEHDIKDGEAQTFYDVDFNNVVNDCRGSESKTYWYDEAKEQCSNKINRDLHALINFDWPDDLNKAVKAANELD